MVEQLGENKVNPLIELLSFGWFKELPQKRKHSLLKIIQVLADNLSTLSYTEIKKYSDLGDNALSDGLKLLVKMKLINIDSEKYKINKDGIRFFNESNLAEDRLNTEKINKFQSTYTSTENSDGIPNIISHISINDKKTENYIYPSGDFRFNQLVILPDKNCQKLIDDWQRDVFVPGVLSSVDQFPMEAYAFRITIVLTREKKER